MENQNGEKKIIIPTEIFEEGGDLALAYGLIYPLGDVGHDLFEDSFITSRSLKHYYGEISSTILKACCDLAEVYGENLGQNTWVFNKDFFKNIDHYIVIPYKYFKLFISELPGLFKYYCHIINSCGKKHYVSLSFETLRSELDIAENTVINYNKKLEKMGVIYICHSKGGFRKDDCGNKIKPYNIYSLPEYKSVADQAAREFDLNTTSNNKRSLTMKYRQIQKGKHYSPEEEKEIMRYVEQHNLDEYAKLDACPGYVMNLL